MSAEQIATFIGQFGFPVVACCAMFWYTWYQNKRHEEQLEKLNEDNREQISKINEEHKEETSKFAEALNNNTLAITKLTEKIGGS